MKHHQSLSPQMVTGVIGGEGKKMQNEFLCHQEAIENQKLTTSFLTDQHLIAQDEFSKQSKMEDQNKAIFNSLDKLDKISSIDVNPTEIITKEIKPSEGAEIVTKDRLPSAVQERTIFSSASSPLRNPQRTSLSSISIEISKSIDRKDSSSLQIQNKSETHTSTNSTMVVSPTFSLHDHGDLAQKQIQLVENILQLAETKEHYTKSTNALIDPEFVSSMHEQGQKPTCSSPTPSLQEHDVHQVARAQTTLQNDSDVTSTQEQTQEQTKPIVESENQAVMKDPCVESVSSSIDRECTSSEQRLSGLSRSSSPDLQGQGQDSIFLPRSRIHVLIPPKRTQPIADDFQQVHALINSELASSLQEQARVQEPACSSPSHSLQVRDHLTTSQKDNHLPHQQSRLVPDKTHQVEMIQRDSKLQESIHTKLVKVDTHQAVVKPSEVLEVKECTICDKNLKGGPLTLPSPLHQITPPKSHSITLPPPKGFTYLEAQSVR
jgi:hypothetical protein